MSVLVFLESSDSLLKKSSIEALVYGRNICAKTGGSLIALTVGEVSNLSEAGVYGAEKVLHITDARFAQTDAQAYAEAIADAAKQNSVNTIVLAKSSLTDSLTAKLASITNAAAATNVVSLPDFSNGFSVKRSIFTGKAFEQLKITSEKKVISIKKNAVEPSPSSGAGTVVSFSPNLSSKAFAIKTISSEKATGEILLSDAEIVVSGGRGLKGPENWGLITDMAKVLGAATGCSKPVSDLHWRPHHEHVGQTGIKVSPNLYFAIGISGAIQHVAGISSSKVIVAINKDADAPIFKAATYGIVGDAFEIVPKLTAALKAAQ
jgi:electron transfer flavoprotein alpha subunit